MADRSHCELQQCSVYQSGMEGLLCLGRSAVTCVGSALVGCGRATAVMCAGAACRGASTLQLTSCRVVNAGGHGVSVEEDSAAQLHGCRVVGSVLCGINITSAERVELESTSVSACSSHGVHCNGGGSCDIIDCVVNACAGEQTHCSSSRYPAGRVTARRRSGGVRFVRRAPERTAQPHLQQRAGCGVLRPTPSVSTAFLYRFDPYQVHS